MAQKWSVKAFHFNLEEKRKEKEDDGDGADDVEKSVIM